MADTRKPLAAAVFGDKAPESEAGKPSPSWYVLGDADLMIPPALQLMMATRERSHTLRTYRR